MKTGFDNDKYLEMQSEHIINRINSFDNKLYLEFGGKLFDDFHASRVLPGFLNNSKIRMLEKLKDDTEIIFCIYAGDIEKNKIRADIGITYDMDILRLIDNISSLGISVNSIVITRYSGQPAADVFIKKMEGRGVKTYIHKKIKGYPTDIDVIASDNGYGQNPYIETTKPLIVVTGPGPGSGKLATCLNQLYHEHKKGIDCGYAKFETFPIWNLPLQHPVNLAYEAATADLDDINMIDPFHLDAYGKTTINYNRDIEAFPVVSKLLSRLTDRELYKSPTDMGVNMAGNCIFDDEAVKEAAKQEIIRRYYKCMCDEKLGRIGENAVEKIKMIMELLNLNPSDRTVVKHALERCKESTTPAVAIELADGTVITGKTTDLMTAATSCVINVIKHLAGISDDILLLPSTVLSPIKQLKEVMQDKENSLLNLQEVLIAISVSTATNPTALAVLDKLKDLNTLDAHSSHMLSTYDEQTFRELGIFITCEPVYPTKDLFFN